VNAYDAQRNRANPKVSELQLYPKNIVVISLLAFFAKVANDKSDFNKLSFLMKGEFEDTIFTRDDYIKLRGDFLKDEALPAPEIDFQDVENAFLMAIGYEKYENPFAKPIYYRGDTCVINTSPFPDCGETSLRNIIMLLLAERGQIDIERFDDIWKKMKFIQGVKHEGSAFEQMVKYFTTYPLLENASLKKAHDDWAQVVSNLNSPGKQELEDIQYGHEKSGRKFEIKGDFSNIGVKGVINMLNVISKVFPDTKLSEKWPRKNDDKEFEEEKGFKLATKKLTRFFEILSTPEREISWENPNGHEFRTFQFHTKDKRVKNLAFQQLRL
jgi:hypothetical protein